MASGKQVEAAAYEFERYVTRNRWASYWNQVSETLRIAPENVVEIGVGTRIFQTIAGIFNVEVQTVDIDPELRPDYVASILDLPFSNGQFDVGVAFQVLEHLPIDESMKGLEELVRVTRRYVIISLPDVQEVWRYMIRVPKLGEFAFTIPRWRWHALPNVKFGNHYWEIGREGFSVKEMISRMERCGTECIRTYRPFENPYHRFFILKVLDRKALG